jgi:GT2 family glycosyltransferase
MTLSNNIKFNRSITMNSIMELTLEIIIPYKENYKCLIDLLVKLQEIKNIKFAVTLVDDNSENLDFHNNFKNVYGMKIIRFDQDKGFGFAVNEAVKQSVNDYFLVLHSDILDIDMNLLKNLFSSLLASVKDNVAAMSAMIDKPLPAECSFLQADSAQNRDYFICAENQFIPFICTIFHKIPFLKVGGFPTYPYCLFEDKLICAKYRLFGYNIAFCPSAFCRHIGGQTVKKLISKKSEILDLIKNNAKLFKKDLEVLKNYEKKPTKDN